MEIKKEVFGCLNSQIVHRYIVMTDDMRFSFIDYGAALQKIEMPDRQGQHDNIIIGFDTLKDYINNSTYAGLCIGRVGGRIANASFKLGDQSYDLEKNMGNHHMHGGKNGLSHRIFETEIIENANQQEIALKMIAELRAEEDGYPGNMKVQITHTIKSDNTWTIHYFAVTDQETLFNPTNHTYFNLNGGQTDVTDHLLCIESASFLQTDDELIPTGKLATVEGAMDYRQSRPVQLGLDTAYRLTGDPCKKRIELLHEASGRQVKVQTDAPYVVVYSAEGMDFTDSSGRHFDSGAGIALETQSMPDAIHHPELDDIRLKETETFQTATSYHFSVLS
ncbi:galactose mutarotase [Macrococcus brunensis]|uniref:Aldose 1-epimerase n=1 Tax=Macrococcus brunensis TaxID=198483 RepID=A0A4R6BDX9_9STAP|nr:aldose epimerase family protein [Macrococcus brunensis]TDL97987.1 galactose mutarotase [Macrococcus brunensis]ULG74012.1 galactose mutarotase [Macrococcus brunensis]